MHHARKRSNRAPGRRCHVRMGIWELCRIKCTANRFPAMAGFRNECEGWPMVAKSTWRIRPAQFICRYKTAGTDACDAVAIRR